MSKPAGVEVQSTKFQNSRTGDRHPSVRVLSKIGPRNLFPREAPATDTSPRWFREEQRSIAKALAMPTFFHTVAPRPNEPATDRHPPPSSNRPKRPNGMKYRALPKFSKCTAVTSETEAMNKQQQIVKRLVSLQTDGRAPFDGLQRKSGSFATPRYSQGKTEKREFLQKGETCQLV